jgi:PAS domain S-box-containing protein
VRVEEAHRSEMLSIYVDDTERRAAEDAVRRSEAMLSHLVATSPDLITLVELETGRLTMVNQTFERLTGYRAAEVTGSDSQALALWRDPTLRASVFERLRRHGQVTDIPVVFNAKDGSLVALQLSGVRFAMNQRDYVVVNARDVSAAQRERLEREAILENASIGIAFTRDRKFVLANPRLEQMLGWPAHSLAGQPARVMWRSDEEYLEVGLRIGALLARGDAATFEQRLHRPDGSSFLARMAARAIDPLRPAASGTIWIVDDVTEERHVEQALERARDAAEAANHAKSAFLANTSHELRTPLNGLTGLARLAATPGLEPARRDQYLRQIVDSAQALAAIISDILDLSKIEAGKLTLEHSAFGLAGLLREVQRNHLVLAEPRGLTLSLELPPALVPQAANDELLPYDITVLGDALRLRQILGNFLTNALKFTAQGGVRLVVQRVASGRWRFEVHDTGPGIEAGAQTRLFQPFTQADESTTRRYGGTGLGLSICRELAELMGGEVGVTSHAGQGSCFWCELPLPQAAAMAPLLPAQAADQTLALRGRRVLVVEDNAVNMLICVALLEQWAVVVTQARDGTEAIELIEQAARSGLPFAAVLMDVQMPGMGGHEATRRLRQRYGPSALPVIALTAAALVSEREAALAAGMDDFLTKPIDGDRLYETLTRWALR